MSEKITKKFLEHYTKKFMEHGPSTEGVDWGSNVEKVIHRYGLMLNVITPPSGSDTTVLDVGCGYGGLYAYAKERGMEISYTGVDIVKDMVDWAKREFSGEADFINGDILNMNIDGESYDYVICNGILTLRLDESNMEMEDYAKRIIREIYRICKKGCVFNMMTTKVNFFTNNLFYKSPAEMLAWCMMELTPYVRVDHSYYGFDYTVYLYKEPTHK